MDGFLPLKAGGFASNLTQKLGKFRLSVDQIGEAMVDVFPLQDFAQGVERIVDLSGFGETVLRRTAEFRYTSTFAPGACAPISSIETFCVSPRRSHNATPSPHVNTVMGKPMHMRMLSRK